MSRLLPNMIEGQPSTAWDTCVQDQDPAHMDRLRTLANFLRLADARQRDRRSRRFQNPAELVQALAVLRTADELMSAALLGDDGLFQHLSRRLVHLTHHDVDLAGACAWRLRRLALPSVIELHMGSSARLRVLRRELSALVEYLDET